MGIWSRIARTFRGDRHSAEIEEELQFHLDMDAAGGHDRRQTRLRLGNVRRIEEETRAVGIIEWLDSTLQDARYGLRQLRRTPALTLAVVLSLAVGLGANTAIFSLVDAAILKPLPVAVRTRSSSLRGPTRDSRRGSPITTVNTPPLPEAAIRARRSPRTCIGAWRVNRRCSNRSWESPRTRTAWRSRPIRPRPGKAACSTSARTSSRGLAPCPCSGGRSGTTKTASARIRS